MSEAKHELPPAMVEAATIVILKNEGWANFAIDGFLERRTTSSPWIEAELQAVTALKAAGVDKLRAALERLVDPSEDECEAHSPSGENCQFFYVDQQLCMWCEARSALAVAKNKRN